LAAYDLKPASHEGSRFLSLTKHYDTHKIRDYPVILSPSVERGDELLNRLLSPLQDADAYRWYECRLAITEWLRTGGHDLSPSLDLYGLLCGDRGVLRGVAAMLAAKWELGQGECGLDPDPGAFMFPPPRLSDLMEQERFMEDVLTGGLIDMETDREFNTRQLTDEQLEDMWDSVRESQRRLEQLFSDARAGHLGPEFSPEFQSSLKGVMATDYWSLPEPKHMYFSQVWQVRYGDRELFDDLVGRLALLDELGEWLLLRDAAGDCRRQIDRAGGLLSEGMKDAAAVICRSSLERALKARARAVGIQIDPKTRAAKVSEELVKAGVYADMRHKQVTAALGIGNAAAHGQDSQYDEGDVRWMIETVKELLDRLLGTD
jgi:hypothetical protein